MAAKYWKNAGKYIKVLGRYIKGLTCCCTPPACPDTCSTCDATYSLTFESYDSMCCCNQASLLLSQGPYTLTQTAEGACTWASDWIDLAVSPDTPLQVQFSLTCDTNYGWKITMTFRADLGSGWEDPYCDDAGIMGFAACPPGAYTFTGGTAVLS